ncbi:MAG TPA: DUF6186 family protein [Jatrophihabitans sp.]
MVISVAWVVLLAAAVTWELYCGFVDRRWVSLTRIAAVVAQKPVGRLFLFAAWAFVGWHLFARYTLPP